MVLKPKGGSKLSLSQMLRGITKGNRHTEQDWGAASAVLVSQEELETLEVLADKKLMRSLSRAEKDERAGRLVCLESANRPLRRPRKGTAAPLSARANSRRPK